MSWTDLEKKFQLPFNTSVSFLALGIHKTSSPRFIRMRNTVLFISLFAFVKLHSLNTSEHHWIYSFFIYLKSDFWQILAVVNCRKKHADI